MMTPYTMQCVRCLKRTSIKAASKQGALLLFAQAGWRGLPHDARPRCPECHKTLTHLGMMKTKIHIP